MLNLLTAKLLKRHLILFCSAAAAVGLFAMAKLLTVC